MKKCRYIKNTFKQYCDYDGIHYYVGIRKLICSYDQFGRMARSNTGGSLIRMTQGLGTKYQENVQCKLLCVMM